jgi:cobalt-zinc-cadmium efflux system outer membrane protein
MNGLWITCILLLLSAPARAEITLEDVLASVDRHYPVITVNQQELLKAQRDELQASRSFDPTLRAEAKSVPAGPYSYHTLSAGLEVNTPVWASKWQAGWRKGVGDFPSYSEDLSTLEGGEVRFGVEVPLLRGGWIDERRVKLRSSELAVQAGEAQLSLTKTDSKRLATLRYFVLIAQKLKFLAHTELLGLAKNRDSALKSRVSRGDAAAMDQVDNQRTVVARESSLISARRSFEKAALDLSLFYRDREGRPIVVAMESVPTALSAQAELPGSLSAHPEVRRLDLSVSTLMLESSQARNSVLPKLDAELFFLKDFAPSAVSKDQKPEFRVGVKLEWPIPMRAARGRVGGVEALADRAQTQKRFLLERLELQKKDLELALGAAKERLQLSGSEVALSKKVEEAERTRFKHGDSNLLMVNLREQATADARLKLIDAQLEVATATTELNALIELSSQKTMANAAATSERFGVPF